MITLSLEMKLKSKESTRLAYLCRYYADGMTLHILRRFTRFLDTRLTLIYFHCSTAETHCQDSRVRCIEFQLMLWDRGLVRDARVCCIEFPLMLRNLDFLLLLWDGVFLTHSCKSSSHQTQRGPSTGRTKYSTYVF